MLGCCLVVSVVVPGGTITFRVLFFSPHVAAAPSLAKYEKPTPEPCSRRRSGRCYHGRKTAQSQTRGPRKYLLTFPPLWLWPRPTTQHVRREADHLHELGRVWNFEFAAELVKGRCMKQSLPRLTPNEHHGSDRRADIFHTRCLGTGPVLRGTGLRAFSRNTIGKSRPAIRGAIRGFYAAIALCRNIYTRGAPIEMSLELP
jgi:hypothetical protein